MKIEFETPKARRIRRLEEQVAAQQERHYRLLEVVHMLAKATGHEVVLSDDCSRYTVHPISR